MSFEKEILHRAGHALLHFAKEQKAHAILHGTATGTPAITALTASMAAHPVGWAIGGAILGGICLAALLEED